VLLIRIRAMAFELKTKYYILFSVLGLIFVGSVVFAQVNFVEGQIDDISQYRSFMRSRISAQHDLLVDYCNSHEVMSITDYLRCQNI